LHGEYMYMCVWGTSYFWPIAQSASGLYRMVNARRAGGHLGFVINTSYAFKLTFLKVCNCYGYIEDGIWKVFCFVLVFLRKNLHVHVVELNLFFSMFWIDSTYCSYSIETWYILYCFVLKSYCSYFDVIE
jgi:hypothetical protein